MKLIGLGLLCLLYALAWADDVLEKFEDFDELQNIPDGNGTDYLEPLKIAVFSGTNLAILADKKLNWFEATEECADNGFTLASITSDADQTDMLKQIKASGLQRILTGPLWLSGSNLANSGIWSWYGNGQVFKFYNSAIPSKTANRCLGFNPNNGAWTFDSCYEKRYMVCQC